MDQYRQLEIKLSQHKSGYKATCKSFPDCSGIGDTQEAALDKLGSSISRFISKVAGKAFKSILLSDRYSEVVLDANSIQKDQYRVFSLDQEADQLSKLFYMRLQVPSENSVPQKNSRDISQLIPDMATEPANPVFPTGNLDIQSVMNKRLQQSNDQEGFMFVFPVSFN
ncbi:hypothetical protein DID77_04735 [Candidatus Marinamargulisbacteria bacterium SCGC AG-439-L15]|nr:hypothetical protein DID77_04735 [Candidatus Marinamargulisbacteria bacterium SCGC AG-439-L15]